MLWTSDRPGRDARRYIPEIMSLRRIVSRVMAATEGRHYDRVGALDVLTAGAGRGESRGHG